MLYKKEKSKIFLLTIFIGLFVVFYFLPAGTLKASDCEVDCGEKCSSYTDSDEKQDCLDQCEEAEDECENLDEKAKVYENIIKLKSKQIDTVTDQLENINAEQDKTRASLAETYRKITTLSEQIYSLEKDIQEKEISLKYQKTILSNLMQSYYEGHQQGIMDLAIMSKSVSEIFRPFDYSEQTSLKVKDILVEIKTAREALEKDRNDLDDKKKESEDAKKILQEKNSNLQYTENQKSALLGKTQEEKEEYKDLLEDIEEQKKQLFDFSSASSIGYVLDSVGDYNKPDKDDRLSTSWYYSQRDSRWKNEKIGVSSLTMEDFGCAVSSVAMVYSYYGKTYTPEDVLDDFDFSGALIWWPSGWHDTGYGYTNYKNKLDDILDDDDIAIIHIRVSGGGHFLVVGGKDKKDYIVHDPYFGSNLYLKTSLALMGELSRSSAYVDRIIYK